MKYYVKEFNGKLRLFIECHVPNDIKFVKKALVENEEGPLSQAYTLYWGCNDAGIVRFYAHTPSHPTGYGGANFKLCMKDGSIETIKGPWSSNSSAMNDHFPHCMPICIVDDRGFQIHDYHMLVEKAEPIIKSLGYDLIYPYFDEYGFYRVA